MDIVMDEIKLVDVDEVEFVEVGGLGEYVNDIKIIVTEKDLHRHLFCCQNVYDIREILSEAIENIKKNLPDNAIEEIVIKMDVVGEDLPAVYFDKEIMEFFLEQKCTTKLLFGRKGEDKTRDAENNGVIKNEFDISGQFVPGDITALLHRDSDREYYNKLFLGENGQKERLSVWRVETGLYSLERFPEKVCDFLGYFLKYQEELREIKEKNEGYFVLDNMVELNLKHTEEMVLTKQVWEILQALQVDSVDIDLYI